MHLPSPHDTNRGPRLPRIPAHGRVPEIPPGWEVRWHATPEPANPAERQQARRELVWFTLAVYAVFVCVGLGYLLAWATGACR